MIDEKHNRIKKNVELNYARIRDANEWLTELRKECDHPETVLVNYEWALGYIAENTTICSICGEVLPSGEDVYWMSYLTPEEE